MKKIILAALLLFVLVGCESDEVDEVSSATGVWDPTEAGLSEADVQFGNERKNIGNSDSTEIRSVRPEVTRFVMEQFSDENSEENELAGLNYRINEKSLSTSFMSKARHNFKNVGYDYIIEIEEVDKISNEEFVSNLASNNNMSEVEIKEFGKVAVMNNSGNSYSAILETLYEGENSSYTIKISSDLMSIPEILMLTEVFISYLN